MKRISLILAALLLVSACSKKDDDKSKSAGPQPTLISVTTAETRKLEILEETVGTIEGLINPTVAAEVAGRVLQLHAHVGVTLKKGQLIAVLDSTDFALQRREALAEIRRIEALLANQGKVVERNQRLVQKNFISQNALDDVATQQDALRSQLDGARAQLALIDHNAAKTRVVAPIDGRVEKQIASPGDFVKVGDPLVMIIGTQKLRAHLPFPENVAARVRPGLPVRLSTPTAPDKVYATTIKELKPLIGSTNRAVDVIADIIDQPDWQGGASVNGQVVLGERDQAVIVPEASVVLRPAGEVVYIIKDGAASQRIVKTGLRQQGKVEITEGLSAGEVVALDGAGFLTDKAPVKLQQAGTEGSKK